MSDDLTAHAGEWVALMGEQVAGVGLTADEALESAERNHPAQSFKIQFIEAASGELLPLPTLLEHLRPIFAQHHLPVYLVGGAIRDALLGRASHDLDFIVPRQAVKLAFQIANTLNVPAYVLDRERDTGRVVFPGKGATLDFARFRGPNLEADLRDRDFTINAIALPATAQHVGSLIDPCGGSADLVRRRIQLTHQQAISDDPVRALRALRLAQYLNFTLTDETVAALITAASGLQETASERIRDELQKLLQTAAPHEAVAQLDQLGLLDVVLPEVANLRHLPQVTPDQGSLLDHTLARLGWLTQIEAVTSSEATTSVGQLAGLPEALATYIPALQNHLAQKFDGGLDGRMLLRLAALFHGTGKIETDTTTSDGRPRFSGPDEAGAAPAVYRLRQLCLSNQAIARVKHIVAGYMRPGRIADDAANRAEAASSISRRTIYRFFRSNGTAGIDICLLSLADYLATFHGIGDPTQWQSLLQSVTTLFHHYFERYAETIEPPPLLNGRDLIQALELGPGPEIGRLLRLIQEAQATAEISSRQEAIELARRSLSVNP